MKKIAALVIAIFLLLVQNTAFAQVTPFQTFDDSTIKTQAGTIMLFNAQTGQDIYSNNADIKIFPASTTKLMTALIALDSGKVDMAGKQTVKVGNEVNAYGEGASLMGLQSGETIPAVDLLYGMLLVSGDDAADAMAIYLAGSVDAFVAQMNTKAKELGMTGTNFTNPHGLQNDQHYMTGADMKKLAMAAFQNSDLMKIAGTKTYTVQPTDLVTETRSLKSTNKLIYTDPKTPTDAAYYYEYATGMKTGSTPTAHGCLVASATKGDLSLIALIFNDPTDLGANRWGIAKQLFEYGFSNYQNVSAADFISSYTVNETISNPAVNDPQAGVVKLTSLPDPVQKTIMLNNDEAAAVKAGTADIKTTLNLTRPLTAPVAQGDVFGTVDFTMNGASVGSAKLAASREVFQVGDEQAQSVALGESPLAYWAETNLGGIDKNPAVLWWLLVPAIAIMLLMMRTVSVNRRKSRATARLHNSISRYSYSYHRPIHRRPRYKGRYR